VVDCKIAYRQRAACRYGYKNNYIDEPWSPLWN
jgi:hypothetical protein